MMTDPAERKNYVSVALGKHSRVADAARALVEAEDRKTAALGGASHHVGFDWRPIEACWEELRAALDDLNL